VRRGREPFIGLLQGLNVNGAASKAIQRMQKRLSVDRKQNSMFRKVSVEIGAREP